MIISGLVLMILGAICFFSGNSTNNNVSKQFDSFFESGKTNPGDVWVYIGVILFIIGLILFIKGIIEYNKTADEPLDAQTVKKDSYNEHSDISITCPKCGLMVLEDNSKFCIHCGANLLEKNHWICQNCDTMNDRSAKFCKNCGFDLSLLKEKEE